MVLFSWIFSMVVLMRLFVFCCSGLYQLVKRRRLSRSIVNAIRESQQFIYRWETNQALNMLFPRTTSSGLTPPDAFHVLLTSFVYDAKSENPIQSFPVHADLVALELITENVIFKLNSNHGASFTCLYRVSRSAAFLLSFFRYG